MRCPNGHGQMSMEIKGLHTCTKCGVQEPVPAEVKEPAKDAVKASSSSSKKDKRAASKGKSGKKKAGTKSGTAKRS